ncbi:MAG: LarC family nickel insertion protein [Desulfovibrio sp.]|nr:LarC family nickel insertion protein [Desulfovibrio sp.]
MTDNSFAVQDAPARDILTIRSHTGISGDILLTGFATLLLARGNFSPDSEHGRVFLSEICARVMPAMADCLVILPAERNFIRGWQAKIELPQSRTHRHLDDIRKIIADSSLADAAKARACRCFELLADCEATAHGIKPEEVHFHEIGALDSILDICITCELYQQLGAPALVCSSLPIADGEILCAHGLLPAPAPATLQLLKDIPVRPFEGSVNAGELLTPTGIALLRALDASFGAWPQFYLQCSVLVYGQREFADVANGAIFAIGSTRPVSPSLPDQGNPLPVCQE